MVLSLGQWKWSEAAAGSVSQHIQFGYILGCLIGCSSRYMLSPISIPNNEFCLWHIELEFLVLKKISTVARVKLFYVACSKNGFLPWTMENDQRQLLAQFRSTSNSGISSGALLVVLQDICFPPRTSTYTYSYTCTSMYSYTYVCTSIHMYYLCVLTYSFMCIHAFLHVMHMH